MLRKTLLAGSALALLSGAAMAAEPVVYVPPVVPPAPAPVGPQAMGSVGVSYGFWALDVEEPNFPLDATVEGSVLEFTGDANIPFGAWNFEIEGGGNSVGIDSADDNIGGGSIDNIGLALNTVGVGTHIYYRSPSFAAGLFGEFQSIGALIDISNWSLGAEAAFFFGSFLVGVEAAWANYSIDAFGLTGDIDSWYAGGDVAYFFNPNLKLEGNVRYTNLDLSGAGAPGDGNIWSFGLTGEYKLAANPLAFFVSGRYDIVDLDDATAGFGADFDINALSVSGGIKVYLGGGNDATLWDHATLGAETFDFSDPLIVPFAD